MRQIGICLLLLSFGTSLYAHLQGQEKIDSLLKELPKQKEDTNKVNVLCVLSKEYSGIKADEGIKYGQQGLELATKLAWKKGMALANKNNGLCYLSKHDLDKAMDVTRTALKMYEAIGDKDGMARAYGNIGIVYQNQNDIPKALEYDSIAVKIGEEAGDKVSVARNANSMAYIYLNQSDFSNALKYYQKALKMHEEVGNKKGMASTIGNIGIAYMNQGNYPKALEYYQKALKMDEEIEDKDGIAAVTCNMGNVFNEQGNHAKALECFLKALKLDEETGNKQFAAIVTGNIGNVYGLQNDWPKALEYHLKSLKMHEELNDKYNIANAMCNIGNAYISTHDNPKALEYLRKSLKLSEEIGNKGGVATAAGNIGTVYLNEGNNTMAIEYMEYSLKLAEEVNDKSLVSNNLGGIGVIYLNIMGNPPVKPAKQNKVNGYDEHLSGKYKSTKSIPTDKAALLHGAIDYLQRSLAIAKEINESVRMRQCYENLQLAYKLNGDYKKALDASDNFHAIKDSVFSKDNNEKIIKMGLNDEYQRQRLTDSLKTVEKEKITAINLQKQKTYTYMGLAGILLLAGFSFFIVKERSKSETERKKSDGLLLNILPTEVAEELKANGSTTAKHYEDVTVLFTDFVNFTEAGERMSPQGLIDELHACFKTFDEITHKYNIEKIKTIGDAYLAVCGLPTADPKHAEHVVHAATEINAFMTDRLAKIGSERTFAVRIGIHSGSVVAGIVGVKKFAYDIWGDTVNTAARMEQNSEAGKINISETTYELVKDKFTCEYRGELEVKGKGVMKMYFVG